MPTAARASVGTHSIRSSYTTDATRFTGSNPASNATTASNQPNFGGLNWTAFRLPTGDTGYTASQNGANYYYGPDQQLYLTSGPGQELPGSPSLGNVNTYFSTGLGSTNTGGTTTTGSGSTSTDPITAAISALANSASSGGGSSDAGPTTGTTVVPTTSGGQPNILLPLLLLAAAGVAVWWYMRHHKGSAGSKA